MLLPVCPTDLGYLRREVASSVESYLLDYVLTHMSVAYRKISKKFVSIKHETLDMPAFRELVQMGAPSKLTRFEMEDDRDMIFVFKDEGN